MPGQIKFEGNIVDTSKPKPDLMGASPASAGSGKRILAHLEHGNRAAAKTGRISTPAWTIDGWMVGLVLLLILISGAAWLVREETPPPVSTFKHAASEASTTVRTETMPTETPPVDRTGQAAAIVNEPASVHVTAGTAPLPAAATPPTAPAIISAAARSVAAAMPATSAQAARSQVAAPSSHKTAGVTTARTPTPTTTTTAAAASANAARVPGDTDVALLTALVAHANKPAIVSPDRSRDIVERQEGDSTALLLIRCKQLGVIEGMLCRSRICSGRWEADAACRAPAR